MEAFRPAVAEQHGELGLGVIGCRYQGSVIAGLAKSTVVFSLWLMLMAPFATSPRLIPPSKSRRDFLKSIYEGVDRHEDYRRLLDDRRIHVILIGAPDHWHAGMLIDALKAGKDVYVEKPIMTIDEGKQIRKVIKTTGGIVQVGSWQRVTTASVLPWKWSMLDGSVNSDG